MADPSIYMSTWTNILFIMVGIILMVFLWAMVDYDTAKYTHRQFNTSLSMNVDSLGRLID